MPDLSVRRVGVPLDAHQKKRHVLRTREGDSQHCALLHAWPCNTNTTGCFQHIQHLQTNRTTTSRGTNSMESSHDFGHKHTISMHVVVCSIPLCRSNPPTKQPTPSHQYKHGLLPEWTPNQTGPHKTTANCRCAQWERVFKDSSSWAISMGVKGDPTNEVSKPFGFPPKTVPKRVPMGC